MQNDEGTPHVLAIDVNHDVATQIVHDYRNQHVYPYLESICTPSVDSRYGDTQARILDSNT